MDAQLALTVSQWIANDPDSNTRAQLQTLLDNNDQQSLAKLFAGRLAFGTAGLRGEVGAGPLTMNRLVVMQTSAGLAQYLLDNVPDSTNKGVIIGYDGRLDSKQFAHDAASVFCAYGIKVRLTHKVAATPLVAFGVKHFDCAAGIVVTASHNPPQYNGYKVYWGNGAQIVAPHDKGIAASIETVAASPIQTLALDHAETDGLLTWLGDDYYQCYREHIASAKVLQSSADTSKVSLAYTAMHGVGAEMAETVLADAGVTQVYSVAAQREPDGHFPTVVFPNPEEKGAMDMVIAEAKANHAMLACANDPDADRFAVAVRRDDGEYQMLTGDQVGILFGHYLLSKADDQQRLVGTTIVSSSLLSKIAASLNGQSYTTLTGFKWLMNIAQQLETDDSQFLFAYEEALGYTVGNMVWDKDGLSALVAFAQLVAELNDQGLTVWDRLAEIYLEHGLHLNAQVSIALKPETPNIGAFLRANPPQDIAGVKVESVDDLSICQRQFADGRTEVIDLPASDVLIYRLAQGGRVIVRPSGTEPKIKCYYELVKPMATEQSLFDAFADGQQALAQFIKLHQAQLPQ